MSQRKNPELDAKHQAILRRMMQLPENKSCADCRGPSPRWASTNLGIFVCIACSGIHRKLGTHISQVRSITLDTWTPAQVARFQKLGNAKASQYFEACLPPDFRRPTSGDSSGMEHFIRDKYEQKRYITVENGGLGGAAVTHRSQRTSPYGPSSGATTTRRGLGQRPGQPTAAYDDFGSGAKSSTRLSYGGRFGGAKSSVETGSFQNGVSTGKYNSGRGLGNARPKNAIQRASTLKEIMNMGFPAQLASRAVEAGEGDLQRAVEWVLQNSDSANTAGTSAGKSQQEAPEHDLLDFGDPTPAPLSGAKTVPSTAAISHSLQKQTNSKVMSPTPPKDNYADFADFGAFESALPRKPEATTHNATESLANNIGVGVGGGLSESLASLYSRTPATSASHTPQGLLQTTAPSSNPHVSAQLHAKTPTRQSPQQLKNPLSMSPRGGGKPNPGYVSSWQLNGRATSSLRTSPILKSSLSPTITLNKNANNSPFGVSPPPPPPMQFLSISETQNVPPPPDCPPPPKEPRVGVSTAKVPKQAKPVEDDTQSNPSCGGKNGSLKSPISDKKREQECEDPFAALSMMALSSASASKKPMKKPSVAAANEKPETEPHMTSPTVPNTDASNGVNLEDFFG